MSELRVSETSAALRTEFAFEAAPEDQPAAAVAPGTPPPPDSPNPPLSPLLGDQALAALQSDLAYDPPPASPTGASLGNLEIDEQFRSIMSAPMPDLREGEGDVS